MDLGSYLRLLEIRAEEGRAETMAPDVVVISCSSPWEPRSAYDNKASHERGQVLWTGNLWYGRCNGQLKFLILSPTIKLVSLHHHQFAPLPQSREAPQGYHISSTTISTSYFRLLVSHVPIAPLVPPMF